MKVYKVKQASIYSEDSFRIVIVNDYGMKDLQIIDSMYFIESVKSGKYKLLDSCFINVEFERKIKELSK